jgi:hypothetical protein
MGQDNAVGTATHYKLDHLGIKFQWGQGALHLSTSYPPNLLYSWYQVFPGEVRC